MNRRVFSPWAWPITAAAMGLAAVAAALATGSGAGTELAALGVSAYPGAAMVGAGAHHDRTAVATTVSAAYETPDSIDRVAAFYRDALRTTSSSQQLFDDPSPAGISLMLSHGPQQRSVVVAIDRSGSGTSIQIQSNLPAARPGKRCLARSGVCARSAG